MKNIDYPVSVYLFGGEGTGWALDADLETTRQSLSALSSLVTLICTWILLCFMVKGLFVISAMI